jgi:hypothetical protein
VPGVQSLDVATAGDEGKQARRARRCDAERVGKLLRGEAALVGWKPRWRSSGAQARARQMLVS